MNSEVSNCPSGSRSPMRAYVGLKKPKRITILGIELAGEIEAVGKDVKLFRKNDQVFAATCFIRMGAYAEYIWHPEKPEKGALALKPVNTTMRKPPLFLLGDLKHCVLLDKIMSRVDRRFCLMVRVER